MVITFLIIDVFTKLKNENEAKHVSVIMVMLDRTKVRTFVRKKAPKVRRLKWTNSTTLISITCMKIPGKPYRHDNSCI